jgi:hypothetical protein
MAAHDITAPALGNPVLFVVDADPQARAVTESALVRRFGPDYRVLAADAPRGGLEALERLAAGGGDVALVAADLRLPGMDGVESSREPTRCTRGLPGYCWWPWMSTTRGCHSANWPRCSTPPR